MAQLKPYDEDTFLWDYVPNFAASIAFTILFFILSGVHLWRMLRSRLWFCVPFVVGGFGESLSQLPHTSLPSVDID